MDTSRVPAREAARDELSDPMYHEHDPNLLERGIDRFWDWISGLFDGAAGAAPGGPVGLVVIVLAVVALGAALWWRLGTPQRTVRTPDALFDATMRSAVGHRRAAAARRRRTVDRSRPGTHARPRTLPRGPRRTRHTPRPHRRRGGGRCGSRLLPAHAARLRTAARVFDDVTYGGRTADEAAYLSLCTLDRDIEAAKPLLTAATAGGAAL